MTGSDVLERGVKPPPVDPRLRARRIEVRRREGRKRLRRLLALLALTLITAAAWGISRSPLLDVDHIEVMGVNRADVEEVIEASGIQRGDALVDLDLAAARTAINELGWVASAEVSKSWWGSVEVTVTERRPIAILGFANGERWLVDQSGHLIDEATAADSALPVVRGVDLPVSGSTVAAEQRHAVRAAVRLPVGLEDWVETIVLEPDGELWLDLAGLDAPGEDQPSARARLGDGRDLDNQLLAVETVLTRVELECLAVIDARVGSAPVVTRHAGCEEQNST